MSINVNINQLEIELTIDFQSDAPAQNIAQEIIRSLELSEETQVTLTLNTKKIDLTKPANTQNITPNCQLEVYLTQNVQITLRNTFQPDHQLTANLWANVSSIEQSLLTKLHSKYKYEVLFKIDGQDLLTDKLFYAQGIVANSVIQYEILIEFFALHQNQRIPFKVNAFTKIDDLKFLIQKEFRIDGIIRLYIGQQELIVKTFYCYAIIPNSEITVEHVQIQQSQITIILCNESQYTDEREIIVQETDLVGVLDQNPQVQYLFKYQGIELDKNKSFKDQGVGNGAKIRFLALLAGNQIKVFFSNQLTYKKGELDVHPNDQFLEKLQILLQDELLTEPSLYQFEFPENVKIENLTQTFSQLNIGQGDTINYYLKNLKVEVYYQQQLHELTFPFNSKIGNLRIALENKFKLQNIIIFQEGSELKSEIELKDKYTKPFHLNNREEEFQKHQEQSSLFEYQFIIIYIRNSEIEIEEEVSKYSTIKQLLIQMRQKMKLEVNQPIIAFVDGEQVHEETLLLNIQRVEVEIVEYYTVLFRNRETQEEQEMIVKFDDEIKQQINLPNCIFYFNKTQLNINQSFKDAEIENMDVIFYEMEQQVYPELPNQDHQLLQQQNFNLQVIESISVNFKFKRKQSEIFVVEKIDLPKDQKVADLLNNLINQFNLERDAILHCGGKKLNEQQTLKENNVKENSLILAQPLLISIILQEQNGQKRKKFVRPKLRVSELIEILAQELHKNQIQLIYNFTPLNGNSTFGELGIVDGSIIELNY